MQTFGAEFIGNTVVKIYCIIQSFYYLSEIL